MLFLKNLLPNIENNVIVHKWNKEAGKEDWCLKKDIPDCFLNCIVESCILRRNPESGEIWYDINLQ